MSRDNQHRDEVRRDIEEELQNQLQVTLRELDLGITLEEEEPFQQHQQLELPQQQLQQLQLEQHQLEQKRLKEHHLRQQRLQEQLQRYKLQQQQRQQQPQKQQLQQVDPRLLHDDDDEQQKPIPWDWHFMDPSQEKHVHDETKLKSRFHLHIFKDNFEELKKLINSEGEDVIENDYQKIDHAITKLGDNYDDFKKHITLTSVETHEGILKDLHRNFLQLKNTRSSTFTIHYEIGILLQQDWNWLFNDKIKIFVDQIFRVLTEMRECEDLLSIKKAFDMQEVYRLFQWAKNVLNIQEIRKLERVLFQTETEVPGRRKLMTIHRVRLRILSTLCQWIINNVSSFEENELKKTLAVVLLEMKASFFWDDMRPLAMNHGCDMLSLFDRIHFLLQERWNLKNDVEKRNIIETLYQTKSMIEGMGRMCDTESPTIFQTLNIKKLLDLCISTKNILNINDARLEQDLDQIIENNTMPPLNKFFALLRFHIDILHRLCQRIKNEVNNPNISEDQVHYTLRPTLKRVFEDMKAMLSWKDIHWLRREGFDMVKLYENIESSKILDSIWTDEGKKYLIMQYLDNVIFQITGLNKITDKVELKVRFQFDINEMYERCKKVADFREAAENGEWSEDKKNKAKEALRYIHDHIEATTEPKPWNDDLRKRLFQPEYNRLQNMERIVRTIDGLLKDDSLYTSCQFLSDLTVKLTDYEGTRYDHPDNRSMVSIEEQESKLPRKYCRMCRSEWKFKKIHASGSELVRYKFIPTSLTPSITLSGIPTKLAQQPKPTAKPRTAVTKTEADARENDDPDDSSHSMDNAQSEDSSSGVFSSSTDQSESLSTSLSTSVPSSPELPQPATDEIVDSFTTAEDEDILEENSPQDQTSTTDAQTKSTHQKKTEKGKQKKEKRKMKKKKARESKGQAREEAKMLTQEEQGESKGPAREEEKMLTQERQGLPRARKEAKIQIQEEQGLPQGDPGQLPQANQGHTFVVTLSKSNKVNQLLPKDPYGIERNTDDSAEDLPDTCDYPDTIYDSDDDDKNDPTNSMRKMD